VSAKTSTTKMTSTQRRYRRAWRLKASSWPRFCSIRSMLRGICRVPLSLASHLLLIGLSLSGVEAVSAQQVDVPVLSAPLVLRGRIARTEIVVPVSSTRESPRVSLDLSYSGTLDPARSTVTFRVNDRPVTSARLADLGSSVDVALAPEAGFQRVSVDARLALHGDPCLLDDRDSAWLTVLPSSRVTYEIAPTDPEEAAPVPVGGIPALWRDLGADSVHIDVPRAQEPRLLLALLDVDHLVRSWGFQPRYGPAPTAEGPRVRVDIEPSGYDPTWEPGADEHVGALARTRGAVLELIATEPEGISRMVAMLSDSEAVRLCSGPTCMVGSSFRPDPGPLGLGLGDGEPVLDLGDAGYPQGWVAAGAGRHQMQLIWQRPPWWQLRRWPELRLRVRLAGQLNPTTDGSRLTIHLNGQPLASFPLANRESDLVTLSTRIPPQYWSVDEWLFRLTARLEDDREDCAASDPDELWLLVEPESGLWVPRTEEVFDGISDFHQAVAAPVLSGDPLLAAKHLPALASILYPFRERLAGGSFRWASRCERHCFDIVRIGAVGETDPVALGGKVWVLDRLGDLRIPLLAEAGLYQLARADAGVVLSVPSEPGGASVPDYAALRGSWAFHVDGAWIERNVDDPKGVLEVGPEGRETLILSREQRRAQLVELLWLCAALAAAALGGFWIWRGYRDRRLGTIEDLGYPT